LIVELLQLASFDSDDAIVRQQRPAFARRIYDTSYYISYTRIAEFVQPKVHLGYRNCRTPGGVQSAMRSFKVSAWRVERAFTKSLHGMTGRDRG